jgi:hypothetical protein
MRRRQCHDHSDDDDTENSAKPEFKEAVVGRWRRRG